MGATDNLRHAADAVAVKAREAGGAGFEAPVRRLQQAAQRVGLAWCGSWLPGMANLYGQALQPAAGGLPRLPELSGSGRVGWVEWAPDDIRRSIHQAAGEPDVQLLLSHAARGAVSFDGAKASSLPLLVAAVAAHGGDAVLDALQREAQQLRLIDHDSLLDSWRPASKPRGAALPGRSGGQGAADGSRDWEVPAHLSELAAIEALRSPLAALQTLAGLLRRATERCKGLVQQATQSQQLVRASAAAQDLPAVALTQQSALLSIPGTAAVAASAGSAIDTATAVTAAPATAKPHRSPAFTRAAQSPLHQWLVDSAGRPRHGAPAHVQ